MEEPHKCSQIFHSNGGGSCACVTVGHECRVAQNRETDPNAVISVYRIPAALMPAASPMRTESDTADGEASDESAGFTLAHRGHYCHHHSKFLGAVESVDECARKVTENPAECSDTFHSNGHLNCACVRAGHACSLVESEANMQLDVYKIRVDDKSVADEKSDESLKTSDDLKA